MWGRSETRGEGPRPEGKYDPWGRSETRGEGTRPVGKVRDPWGRSETCGGGLRHVGEVRDPWGRSETRGKVDPEAQRPKNKEKLGKYTEGLHARQNTQRPKVPKHVG
jgi:hypothetical protein